MSHARTVARLELTIAVVGTLLHFVDWRQVLSALIRAELAWLLPAYALVVGRRAIEVAQMTLLLGYVGCEYFALTPWLGFMPCSPRGASSRSP